MDGTLTIETPTIPGYAVYLTLMDWYLHLTQGQTLALRDLLMGKGNPWGGIVELDGQGEEIALSVVNRRGETVVRVLVDGEEDPAYVVLDDEERRAFADALLYTSASPAERAGMEAVDKVRTAMRTELEQLREQARRMNDSGGA
ncbi:hypothetical protein ACFSKW_12120 [Nonomuraea mangrovi]|uniref:Uncharacterized protein n=1 Tax=Nonomuraea mangrovi TaxID=2316207 RepID=A0ABW4STG6_9ACTN